MWSATNNKGSPQSVPLACEYDLVIWLVWWGLTDREIFSDKKSSHILNYFCILFYSYIVTGETLIETQCVTECRCFQSLIYIIQRVLGFILKMHFDKGFILRCRRFNPYLISSNCDPLSQQSLLIKILNGYNLITTLRVINNKPNTKWKDELYLDSKKLSPLFYTP